MPNSQTAGQQPQPSPQLQSQQSQSQQNSLTTAVTAVVNDSVAPQPPPQPPPQQQSQQMSTSGATATAANNNNTNSNEYSNTANTNTNTNTANTAAGTENARLHPHAALSRPSVALSQAILPLYGLINSKYSEERRRRQPGPKYNDGYDDRHGHYLVFTGEVIWGRYTVQGVLGRGSFGTVLKCFDEKHQEQVAAKVIRNGEYFYNQGLMEVDIVARLNRIPPLDNLVVRLGKVFVWKGHLVLVFEMLSMNLFQLIQRTNYNGVSLDLTRKFAYQLILVLKQLEDHNPPIIHCDVKPENVVLRDPSRSSIRLIDFGSACYLHPNAKLYKYVQSRFYRSAEVILELGYDTAIDRWSLGCMLVELHTGVPLFAGRNESDQLARFIGVLGPLPDEMIERSPKKDVFFMDSRQSQNEAFVHHSAGMGENTAMAEQSTSQQRREHVASPSPVIAAEVLHSLSATSSISVVTAASTAPAWSYTDHADNATVTSSGAQQEKEKQQQKISVEAVGTAAENRPVHRTPSSTPGNNNNHTSTANVHNNNNTNSNSNTVAVPALRRPRTTFAMLSSYKKDAAVGQTTTIGSGTGGSLTPTAIRRNKFPTTPTNNALPQKTLHVTGASSAIPQSTLPARSILGPRPSNFTPRLRLTSSSHAPVHNEGGGNRNNNSIQQVTISTAEIQQHQQQQQQKQKSVSPPRSPFVLRYPPAQELCHSLEDIIGVYSGGPRGCRQGQTGHGVEDYKIFLDFIQRLLCYDPRKRMTCTEALQHPFLSELEMHK